MAYTGPHYILAKPTYNEKKNSPTDIFTVPLGLDITKHIQTVIADTVTIPTSEFLTTTVSISSAQLLNILASPAILIVPPGAGKVIDVLSCSTELVAGTTPYTAVGVTSISIIRGTQVLFEDALASTFTGGATAAFTWFHNPAIVNATDNASIRLRAFGANLAGGDYGYKVYLSYRIITL